MGTGDQASASAASSAPTSPPSAGVSGTGGAGSAAPALSGVSVTLRPAQRTLCVADAVSGEAKTKGLSGVDTVPSGLDGMLFRLGRAKERPAFWMKDVRFDIDILYLNQSGTVVGSAHMVKCEKQCDLYRAPVETVTALELPASAGFDLGAISAVDIGGGCAN